MSTINDELTRIINARNKIRNALVRLGRATQTDKLPALADAVDSIGVQAGSAAPLREDKVYYPATQSGYIGFSSFTVSKIPDKYQDTTDVTATAPDVLSGKVFVNGNGNVTGTMPNIGTVTPAELAAGGSYTIPAGKHSGSGVVKAKSLASQTGVDSGKTAVTPVAMLPGYQGWVNGSKITGSMADSVGMILPMRETDIAASTVELISESFDDPTKKGSYYIQMTPGAAVLAAGYMTSSIAEDSTKWENYQAKLGIKAGDNNGVVNTTFTGLGVAAGDTGVTLGEGYYKSISVSLAGNILAQLQSI